MSTCLPAAGPSYFNDLYHLDPATATWTKLNPSGSPPAERHMMGFTATPDGALYVFGGFVKHFIQSGLVYGSNVWREGRGCGMVGRKTGARDE